MPKETYVPHLLELFRQHGYDGATLSKISEATGLGKASLYHHFPGGKDEMVSTVLAFLERWMEQRILTALQSDGDTLTRMQRMCDQINELYQGGEKPCLFAILLMGSARDVFYSRVNLLFRVWLDAIAQVLHEAGLDETTAMHRSEDAAIVIQGSLILSQGLGSCAPFQRALKELPHHLCQGL
jgi:TetR/AcrR family transcriptional regulator, lmrAB and yxaGH operons repressor